MKNTPRNQSELYTIYLEFTTGIVPFTTLKANLVIYSTWRVSTRDCYTKKNGGEKNCKVKQSFYRSKEEDERIRIQTNDDDETYK